MPERFYCPDWAVPRKVEAAARHAAQNGRSVEFHAHAGGDPALPDKPCNERCWATDESREP